MDHDKWRTNYYGVWWLKIARLHLAVTVCFLLLSLISTATVSGSSVKPRSVNPYGMTLNDAYGSLTPTVNMNMSAFGMCAQKPNPTTLLGVPCNNGNTNATFVFNVTGFELQQVIYLFSFTGYGNGTVQFAFIGIPPGFILASTIIQSTTYTSGSERILNTRGGTDILCVSYGVATCAGSNGGGGGGGGGSGGPGIPGITTPGLGGFCISCYGFNLLMFMAIGSTSFIFILGAVRRRKR